MRFREQFIRLSDEIIVTVDKHRGIGGAFAADKVTSYGLTLVQICVGVWSSLNPRHSPSSSSAAIGNAVHADTTLPPFPIPEWFIVAIESEVVHII